MSDDTTITCERAGFEPVDGGWRVTLARELAHPPERIWSWLTESAGLREWLAPGEMELIPGGRVRIEFEMSGEPIDSRLLELEPGRRLAYSWSQGEEPERPIRWLLEPGGGVTRLVLTLGLQAGDRVALSAAGWDAHLQMLEAALEGVPISFPVARFKESRQQFEEALPAP
ncbi:SRPBCC family protein [Halomonadaceae bacterium KBTZ08]